MGQPIQCQIGSNFQNVDHFDRKERVFQFFLASSVTVIAMKNLKDIRKLFKRPFANMPSGFGLTRAMLGGAFERPPQVFEDSESTAARSAPGF